MVNWCRGSVHRGITTILEINLPNIHQFDIMNHNQTAWNPKKLCQGSVLEVSGHGAFAASLSQVI